MATDPFASLGTIVEQPRVSPSPRVQSVLSGDPRALILVAAGNARVTSGYRDPRHNAQVGGVSNSYHTRGTGQALDLVPQGGETMEQLRARLAASGLPLAELINEKDHVHVAWNGTGLGDARPQAQQDDFAGLGEAVPSSGASFGDQVVDAGYDVRNGRVILNGQDMGTEAEYLENQRRSQADREARATRMADPAYQLAMEEAKRGSANVPDALRAFGQGQSLGFLDEINAGAQGALQGLENVGRQATGQPIRYSAEYAAQAARDAERDAQRAYAAEHPLANFGLQLAGGLLTPGVGVAGDYISGAQGSARLARAGQVGAGYGAASGFGNAEGNVLERVPETVIGGLVGAGTGVVGQRVADRIALPKVPSNSAARILSREGVDLTPGQMFAETPGVGNILRSLEEGASSIPFVGSPIAGARQQSVESFNRAAINRVLEPIGEKIPSRVKAGYDAVDHAQQRVSEAYDKALAGVRMTPDQAMYDDLGRAVNSAVENSGVTGGREVINEINERVFRVLGDYAYTPMTGQQFKALESEFGNLASNALQSSDGATRAVGRAYQAVNDGLRSALRRQNPTAADELSAANSAYARLMRIERAAASTASQQNDGVFTPTQLGQAVGQMGSRRANARGDALLQDLAVAGRSIIPSRVGDSGTATRGAITGLVAGGAAGAPVAGAVAIPVVATSIAYSRPAQAALNAIYRATDSQGASSALHALARLAQRNPALVPYYQDAAEFVLSLGRTQEQASPQAQPQAQTPSPALQRVLQP